MIILRQPTFGSNQDMRIRPIIVALPKNAPLNTTGDKPVITA